MALNGGQPASTSIRGATAQEMFCILANVSVSVARDPSKRRVKPTAQADLLPLALESESEDSDFRIEDNAASDGSSSGGSSSDSGSDSLSEGEDEQEITDVTPPFNGLPAEPQPIQVAQAPQPPVASAAVRCKMTDFQLVNILTHLLSRTYTMSPSWVTCLA